MNKPLSRAKLQRLTELRQAYNRRIAKDVQRKNGWYDEHGVRQGGLIAFVRYFWHVLEPETAFIDGFPLWAMCEHLEAVTRGEITRLLINVPPGFMKSMLVDVWWPAWEWGPKNMAHLRYVAFSYAATLTERDNGRFRDLITSQEYQRLYGDRVSVKYGTRAASTRISNSRKGWKFASSVGGVGTGERGDRVILDDPHNVKDTESQTIREETTRWFRESMSNRFNDPKNGAIIVIMQRLHENDISGEILALGLDYIHLMIPMEYDWTFGTFEDGQPRENAFGWIDPRYDPDPNKSNGVLAWPERFNEDDIAKIKKEVGDYGWSGQYSQTPVARGGGLFKIEWWQPWMPNDNQFPFFDYVFASLDGAYTDKQTNDPSAMTVWGTFVTKENRRAIMLVHAWRRHLQFSAPPIERLNNESLLQFKLRTSHRWGLMECVMHTCHQFRVDKLLIEAKASGISAAQELQNRYGIQPFSVQLCQTKGDKYARALAVQPLFSQGMVWAPVKDWWEEVANEMAVFPKGRYDDLTDTVSQALKYARDNGLLRTPEEETFADRDRGLHRSRPKALYPV